MPFNILANHLLTLKTHILRVLKVNIHTYIEFGAYTARTLNNSYNKAETNVLQRTDSDANAQRH